MVRTVIALVGLLALPWGVVHAEVTASFDRDTIRFNETVRLSVKTDNEDNSREPSLEPIDELFHVLGRSSGQNISVVNGQRTISSYWLYELEPKSVGSFTVGPITVGAEETRPVRITVLPEDQSAGGAEVFVELELDADTVYVQQQLLLTVRLFLGVPIVDGALGDPGPSNTVVRRLDQDRDYSVERGGRQYRVFERSYALFPQASGPLEIPPLRFQGAVDEGGRAGVFGSLLNPGRRIRASSKTLNVEVRPPAARPPGEPWVPARALKLFDLGDDADGYAVGKPLTLKLQLQALGLTAEQLPEIQLPEVDGMRLYPDQPVLETQEDDGSVLGIQLQRVAVIPGRSGELTIPGIDIHWWNTETDQRETASLEPRTIQVAPADSASVDAVSGIAEPLVQPDALEKPGAGLDDGKVPGIQATRVEVGYWRWIAIASLCLWLVTALGLVAWLWRRRSNSASEIVPVEDSRIATLRSRLRRACQDNDPAAARQALERLFRALYPGVGQLDTLGKTTGNMELAREIEQLERALYAAGNPEVSWDGAALWQACKKLDGSHSAQHRGRPDPLEPLYPA